MSNKKVEKPKSRQIADVRKLEKILCNMDEAFVDSTTTVNERLYKSKTMNHIPYNPLQGVEKPKDAYVLYQRLESQRQRRVIKAVYDAKERKALYRVKLPFNLAEEIKIEEEFDAMIAAAEAKVPKQPDKPLEPQIVGEEPKIPKKLDAM